jgi:hypothetical protein
MAKNTGRQNNFLQPMMKGSIHLGAQVFFLLGEGGSVGFLLFPMCSHEVLAVFPSHSQWVPSMFPSSQYVHHMFPISILGLSKTFLFFLCDGSIKDACHDKKTLKFGGPHN